MLVVLQAEMPGQPLALPA